MVGQIQPSFAIIAFVDYAFVLDAFGGDIKEGRRNYKKQLEQDLGKEFSLKDKVIGQSILGGEDFVTWVTESFLKKTHGTGATSNKPGVQPCCSRQNTESNIT